MQALGFEDGLSFPLLTAFVVGTLGPSCPAAGAEVPASSLPGYLDTWVLPGPGGSLDRQAGVIARSRHTWDGETWVLE